MVVDFHSHILPEFDDGAENSAMSLKMIEESQKMGVTDIVSTSHCYPIKNSDIMDFIAERNFSFGKLLDAARAAGKELPKIHLGCEVHLTCDLMKFSNIKSLCVEGTDYMLLEMPSSPWSDNTIDNVYKLTISGIRPIIAHAERNLSQKAELLNSLYDLDILIQINAVSFGIPQLKKFIDKMFATGMIHVIGTDMHNITTRSPNIDRARKYICKRYGTGCWEYLMRNASLILGGNILSYRDLEIFRKKSLFGKK